MSRRINVIHHNDGIFEILVLPYNYNHYQTAITDNRLQNLRK